MKNSVTPGSTSCLPANHWPPKQGTTRSPKTCATDAVTSGDNPVAFEAGLAARQDAFQRSNAEPGGPASGNLSSETIAPDPDEPREAITQADEPTIKYFGNTEIQPRRAARPDFEAGPNADFHPGMPLTGDLSIRIQDDGSRRRRACSR